MPVAGPNDGWRDRIIRNRLGVAVTLLVVVGMCAAAWQLLNDVAIDTALPSVDWLGFVGSALLLSASFVMRAAIWHGFLRGCGFAVTWRRALASRLIPMFAKYLPGKVWSLLGTTLALNEQRTTFRGSLALATAYQGAIVIAGLVLGTAGILVYGARFGLLLPAAAVLTTSFLGLVAYFHNGVRRLLRRLTQRLLGDALAIRPGVWIAAVGANLGSWLLVGIAQWGMIHSMGLQAGYAPILMQPLAHVAGMLVVIAPGGIGVREGVMVTYLRAAGLDLQTAVLVSLVARVWSVAGEFGAFVIGLVIGRSQHVES